MELIKVLVIFIVILALLNKRLPLYLGMLCGTVLMMLLFGIDLPTAGATVLGTLKSWDMWSVMLAMYVISVLIWQLNLRSRFQDAQHAMNGLLKDARINTAIACVTIGLMPGPATVSVCGGMVDSMAGDRLKPDEKAAVSTFLRHIPEGIIPTFPGVIMACSISGLPASSFFLWMLPILVMLIAITYFVYLRKVPKQADTATVSKAKSLKLLFRSLWSLLIGIALIIVFNLPTWAVIACIVVVNAFVEKLSFAQFRESLIKGLEYKTLLGIIMTYVFKDMLVLGGVIKVLPSYFEHLPIPAFLVLVILYFFGTLVASNNASAAAFIPLAYTMIPDGGVFLLVLLMSAGFSASQISPTHICTPIISDYFDVTFLQTVRKVLPLSLLNLVFSCLYYLLLVALF